MANNTQHKTLSKIEQALLCLFSLILIGVSGYLCQHFFEVHFPKSLASGGMCEISSFWSCDTATLSPISSIFHVPIAAFGALFGFILLITSLFNVPRFLPTITSVSFLNAIGCLALCFYSIIILKGLCPGCTIYYIISICCFLLLWRSQRRLEASPAVFSALAIAAAILFIGFYGYNQEAFSEQEVQTQKFLTNLKNSRDFSPYEFESHFRLASATEKFEDAPLRITIFSDFECPACKFLATDILPRVEKRYAGKINIQYVFFPMDSACNPSIKSPFHLYACHAAKIAYCAKDKFSQVHDELYFNQEKFSGPFLDQMAKKYNVSQCVNSTMTQNRVTGFITNSAPFGVDATPTIFINGRRFDGVLPIKFFVTIMDHILTWQEH